MSYTTKTFNANNAYLRDKKRWLLVDAYGAVLGRLAARIALVLRGKNKEHYTPFIDCGDSVVVINAAKVKVTGKKLQQNKFFWHSGYPGGIKHRTFAQILGGDNPERLLMNAVRRMMPKESPLARRQLKNLYIYPNSNHPHMGQTPEAVNLL